jgi:hypothetical protein
MRLRLRRQPSLLAAAILWLPAVVGAPAFASVESWPEGQEAFEGEVALVVPTLAPVGGAPGVQGVVGARTTAENAAELARNLGREGRAVGTGEAAGHIVPSTGTKGHWASGARSRELLARYDIGVNDAANGIPIGHPRPHSSMHTREFLQSVESRLKAVESGMLEQGYGHRAIRSALRRELRVIGRETLGR